MLQTFWDTLYQHTQNRAIPNDWNFSKASFKIVWNERGRRCGVRKTTWSKFARKADIFARNAVSSLKTTGAADSDFLRTQLLLFYCSYALFSPHISALLSYLHYIVSLLSAARYKWCLYRPVIDIKRQHCPLRKCSSFRHVDDWRAKVWSVGKGN